MAEEEWITQTQESLGKLISKPKMTEKYLKKPPFRFLHDIVMEVVRSTNFAQGLYTPEECDAAQLSDKGAKVDFLNKAINVTCFALGEQVAVSANKIVAGLEADKTNLWLQKLHTAATTCVGAKSDDAVQRVLAGESVGGAKEKKKKKDDEPKADEAKPAAGGDDAAAAEEEAKRKEEEKKRRAERKKKEEEKKRAAEEAEAAKAAEEEAAKAKAAADADAAARAGEAEEEEAAKREKREEEKRKKEEEKKRREEKKRAQAEAEEKQKQEEAAAAAAAQAQAQAAVAAAAEEERRAAAAEAEHFQEMPSAPGSAAQGTRPMPGDDEAAREAMMRGEMGEDDMGGRAQARPERPRTAGRRPPKLASKVQQSAEQAGPAATAQAPVIIAEGAKDDDDEDTFEQPANESVGFGMLKAEEGGQHGKLVSNLLAEKKKEEEKERLKKEEEETREEFDDGQGKGIRFGKLKRKKGDAPQQVEVDIGALGGAIQSLCQAANPLGKSIDLVHQDIANMGKELDHWKQEYREASEQYQMQLKKTDELLQPLYQKVAELDDKIAEQKTKIRNSRSRISKNDLKIQGLLESVVCAK